MDRLSEIPTNPSTVKTPEEAQIMNQFFVPMGSGMPPAPQPHQPPQPGRSGPYPVYDSNTPNFDPEKSYKNPSSGRKRPPEPEPEEEKMEEAKSASGKGKINWKLLGVVCLAFILLANPWVDGMLEKISYLEEKPTLTFGVRFLLFAVIVLVANFFM